jgi:hypothetical protein
MGLLQRRNQFFDVDEALNLLLGENEHQPF